MKYGFYLPIVFFVFMLSCQSNNETPEINLQKDPNISITLNSKKIFGNFELIQLESKDECLIGGYYKVIPTDNNIIIYTRERILQFDYSGRFLGILANKGNGPGELSSIINCIVDEKHDKLYCIQQSDQKNIHIYDLKSNKFEKNIPRAINGALGYVQLLNDSILACFPKMDLNGKYLVYYQDLKGNFIDGIPYSINQRKGTVLRKAPEIIKDMEEKKFLYFNQKIDTLFEIDSLKKNAVVSFKKDASNQKNSEMNVVDLIVDTEDFLVLCNEEFKLVNSNDGSIIMKSDNKRYLTLKLPSLELSEIDNIHFDLFGEYYKVENKSVLNNINTIRNKNIVLSYSYSEFIDIAESMEENNTKDPLGIVDLSDELNENDNPVLLIGKLR
ncbi:MAG: 6-bladed beta-propeller [Thermotogota bacterium]